MAYHSKRPTLSKQHWQVHNQELGAIVAYFTEWRFWLAGTNEPVVVLSDHANLCYFIALKKLTPWQVRWASWLSMFNLEVLHTPRKLNPANPASCRPDYVAGKYLDRKVVLLIFQSVHTELLDICTLSLTTTQKLPPDISFMPTDHFILHCVQELYVSDPLILEGVKSFLTLKDSLWWWKDWLYVPVCSQNFLIGKFHSDPASGHWVFFLYPWPHFVYLFLAKDALWGFDIYLFLR